MDFQNYTSEDFFHDPNFRKWVNNPDPEIQYFWEKWLLNHPDKKGEVMVAKKMVKTLSLVEYEWSEGRKQDLWKKILDSERQLSAKTKKDSKVITLDNQSKDSNKQITFYKWVSRAAVFIGILVLSYFLLPKQNTPLQEVHDIVSINKFNPKGQKSRIFLPDGSVAYLNSNSSLTYNEEFADGRHVLLSGEAYFDVVKDPLRPFVVSSNGIETKVLGTSFNVKAFSDDDLVVVSVVEGEVKVSSGEIGDSLLVTPGFSAKVSTEHSKMEKISFDYIENIGWKDGILQFNQDNLVEAFKDLEMWYGVTFIFNKNPDPKILVNGKFENTYLTNVLKSLSYSVDFEYAIEGNNVNVNFK